MGIISVIGRQIGDGDISFGANSFVYTDVNGVSRRLMQVNAKSIPWYFSPGNKIECLVDGSKVLPVGASSLGVVNTSIFSGSIYGSGTTSGFIKNHASGMFVYGQSILTAEIPSGIPASNIAAGIVNDTEFGYIDGLTSTAQTQIDNLAAGISSVARLQYFQPEVAARLVWLSNTTVNVNATVTNPALVCMSGFPDMLNPGQFVSGALSDSVYRQNTAAEVLTFPDDIWGDTLVARKKFDQWYAVYAIAEDADTTFTLKAMPYMRWFSEAGQVIKLARLVDPTVNKIGYGLATDELVGSKLYILSGANAGAIRTITANNNNNTNDGSVTYSGAALAGMAQGNWMIVLPKIALLGGVDINFRWVGDVYNNAGGIIEQFDVWGNTVCWMRFIAIDAPAGTREDIRCASPLATCLGAVGDAGTFGHPDGTPVLTFNFSHVETPMRLCKYAGVGVSSVIASYYRY